MGLAPKETETEVERLCVEGIRKLPKTTELYIRPMFFARGGFVVPEPESTEFCLSVYDAPLPEFDGIKIRFSAWRRPAQDMALTNAKAGALFPNSSRALREALELGFDNAVVKDANGNIAELATANLWMVKDNVASTPALTGTFLAGVTRYRVACLLRENGIAVEETTLTESDLRNADEIFSTGNFAKVQPVVQLEDRTLEIGPICILAYQRRQSTSIFECCRRIMNRTWPNYDDETVVVAVRTGPADVSCAASLDADAGSQRRGEPDAVAWVLINKMQTSGSGSMHPGDRQRLTSPGVERRIFVDVDVDANETRQFAHRHGNF